MSTKGKGKSMSQRTRSQAALFCRVKASNTEIPSDTIMAALGLPETAFDLAWEARLEASERYTVTDLLTGVVWSEGWAEAEAMLRTGWCPGKGV